VTRLLRVLILDMQPIDPPVGGGRIRLLGLYHDLGPDAEATYLGSYDWPGPGPRRLRLTPRLTEIDVPLSAAHFAADARLREALGGKVIIDATFPLLHHLTPRYGEEARRLAGEADVVVVSHPWVWPAVRDAVDPARHLLVYDAHNVEGLLRADLLEDGGAGTEVARAVAANEFELAHRADLLLACSAEDAAAFTDLYGVPAARVHEVPNGVFTRVLRPPSPEAKAAAREGCGLTRPSALFLGSPYGPNLEAAAFVVKRLAPTLPAAEFLLCGGVADCDGAAPLRETAGPNVRFVGRLSEEEKPRWLHAADVAVNPMFSGSGTNIKMFDFLAAGLPTVATPTGARGIDPGHPPAFLVASPEAFAGVLSELLGAPGRAAALAVRGRDLVERRFGWEAISPSLGALFLRAFDERRDRRAGSPPTPALPSVRETPAPTPAPTVHLTTWGARCGIAEHAAHVEEVLAALGARNLLLSAWEDGRVGVTDASEPARPMAVQDMWAWGAVEPASLASACLGAGARAALLHYHPVFFPPPALARMASALCASGIRTAVVLHNSRDVDDGDLVALVSTGAALLVHNGPELARLRGLGAGRAQLVPMGVPEVPDEPAEAARARLGLRGGPVVGSFGFLRPHKGVPELIEAMALVREVHPGAVLLGLHALYPDPDSEACLAECRARIAAHGLEEAVRLETGFRGIAEVVRDLHACDVVALPYRPSPEGASASAHTALAARRPVLFTRQEIFRPLAALGYTVESTSPQALAAGLLAFLSSPPLREQSARRVREFGVAHGWRAVGAHYARVLYGPPGGAERSS